MFLALYIRQPKEFLTQTSQLLSPSRCLNLCLEQSRLTPLNHRYSSDISLAPQPWLNKGSPALLTLKASETPLQSLVHILGS